MTGIDARARAWLDRLHRETVGPFTADDAATTLGISRERAARFIRYLAGRNWLSRVRRGVFITVPLGTRDPAAHREDAWVVASALFAPCYIAGWSALEHWALTEQLFRSVSVVTTKRVRARDVSVQGMPFRLKHVPDSQHFGLRTVWRGRVRVRVSDPSRTIVDILDDPAIGGGVRHVADALFAYWHGDHRNVDTLLAYARRRGNRTVFKRLGYLAEALQLDAPKLVETCRGSISAGLSPLDPAVHRKGKIVKRWNLRVNVVVKPPDRS